MVGDEAAPLRAFLEITYPLKEGKIGNWEDMEHLWTYCFEKKLNLPNCLMYPRLSPCGSNYSDL